METINNEVKIQKEKIVESYPELVKTHLSLVFSFNGGTVEVRNKLLADYNSLTEERLRNCKQRDSFH